MSCIYGIADETGSAMSLIHRALTLHALYMDKSPLHSSDYMISYLCYNAGLYLQNHYHIHTFIIEFRYLSYSWIYIFIIVFRYLSYLS